MKEEVAQPELMPCPWCHEIPQQEIGKGISGTVYRIVCLTLDCKVRPRTHLFSQPEAAANAWNTRVSAPLPDQNAEFVRGYEQAREDATDVCVKYEHRHSSGYLCDSGTRLALQIAALVPPTPQPACPCCGGGIPCSECGPFTDETKAQVDDSCRRCGKCINHCPHQ